MSSAAPGASPARWRCRHRSRIGGQRMRELADVIDAGDGVERLVVQPGVHVRPVHDLGLKVALAKARRGHEGLMGPGEARASSHRYSSPAAARPERHEGGAVRVDGIALVKSLDHRTVSCVRAPAAWSEVGANGGGGGVDALRPGTRTPHPRRPRPTRPPQRHTRTREDTSYGRKRLSTPFILPGVREYYVRTGISCVRRGAGFPRLPIFPGGTRRRAAGGSGGVGPRCTKGSHLEGPRGGRPIRCAGRPST